MGIWTPTIRLMTILYYMEIMGSLEPIAHIKMISLSQTSWTQKTAVYKELCIERS